MSSTAPKLGKITRDRGVAGQISYSVTVTYPGESPETVTFVGSTYGGPVVMVSDTWGQQFVRNAERHGAFGEAWVRSFYAER